MSPLRAISRDTRFRVLFVEDSREDAELLQMQLEDAGLDAQYLRVTRLTEPFSYIVPLQSFGSTQELWDQAGKVVSTLSVTSLREGGGGGFGGGAGGGAAADTGKRNVQWNPVGPGLVYLQSVFAAARNGEWTREGDEIHVAGQVLAPGEYELALESPEGVTAAALRSNDAVVTLDTVVTPELAAEGLARDVIRAVKADAKLPF